jgi:hypothetical protein
VKDKLHRHRSDHFASAADIHSFVWSRFQGITVVCLPEYCFLQGCFLAELWIGVSFK